MSKPYPLPEQWYPVFPREINRALFEKKRSDPKQEKTRQFIQSAFQQFDLFPLEYFSFETLILPFYFDDMSFSNLIELPSEIYGGTATIANKTDQGLEWAQRIHNGESWESLCNEPDSCPWQRVLFTDNAELLSKPYPIPNRDSIPFHERHIVGGSKNLGILLSTTHIEELPVLFRPYCNLTPLCKRYIR